MPDLFRFSLVALLLCAASGVAAQTSRPAPDAPVRGDTLLPGTIGIGAAVGLSPGIGGSANARLYLHPFIVDGHVGRGQAERFLRDDEDVTITFTDVSLLVPFLRRRGLVPGSYQQSALGLMLSTETVEGDTKVGIGVAASGGLVVSDRAELFIDSALGVNLIRPDDSDSEYYLQGLEDDFFSRLRFGLRFYP